MLQSDKRKWLVAGAVLAGVLAGARLARDARLRRERLRRGELVALRGAWRRIGGIDMYARVALGDPERRALPVVLVHGFGVSSTYFVPTAERLGARFDVYSPDLPGHGRSATPPHAYDVSEQADALTAWMDAMGIERASLVANSMGCQFAVETARRHPARVERLVLIGPTLDPAARNLLRLGGRFLYAALYEDWLLGVHIVRDYLRMGPRIPRELLFMLRYPTEARLREIRVPALFVRGEHDAIAPRAWIERGVALVGKNARWIELPGGAHAVNYGAADALVECIAPFLGD